MLSTFVIVALQDSRKVFSFLLTNWLRIPWFFSRGRTRLAFSFFLTYNFFSFFPRAMIRDTFISCSWRGFFRFFFLVPWMLVDIRLVNIYIYSLLISIYLYVCMYAYNPFVYFSHHISICLSIYLSECMYVWMYVYNTFIYVSHLISIYLSIDQFLYIFVCMTICLFIYIFSYQWECPGYDCKQSECEDPVLEFWGMGSTPSLSLLPGPLWPRVIIPVSFPSMVQIELFINVKLNY